MAGKLGDPGGSIGPEEPATMSAVHLACAGVDEAELTLRTEGPDAPSEEEVIVVWCDTGVLEWPIERAGITTVAVRGSSESGDGEWVAIVDGTTT